MLNLWMVQVLFTCHQLDTRVVHKVSMAFIWGSRSDFIIIGIGRFEGVRYSFYCSHRMYECVQFSFQIMLTLMMTSAKPVTWIMADQRIFRPTKCVIDRIVVNRWALILFISYWKIYEPKTNANVRLQRKMSPFVDMWTTLKMIWQRKNGSKFENEKTVSHFSIINLCLNVDWMTGGAIKLKHITFYTLQAK